MFDKSLSDKMKKVFALLFTLILLSPVVSAADKEDPCKVKDLEDLDKKIKGYFEGCSSVDQLKVHGTEYQIGDNQRFFVQALNIDGSSNDNSSCFISMYSPDIIPIKLIDEALMDSVGENGLYFYDNIASEIAGVYMLSSSCFLTTEENEHYPNATQVKWCSASHCSHVAELTVNDNSTESYQEQTVTGTKRLDLNFTVPAMNHTNLEAIAIRWVGTWNSGVGDNLIFSVWNFSTSDWLVLPNQAVPQGTTKFTVTNTIITNTSAGLIDSGGQVILRMMDTNLSDLITSTADTDLFTFIMINASNETFQEIKGSGEAHIGSFGGSTNVLNGSSIAVPDMYWNWSGLGGEDEYTYFWQCFNFTNPLIVSSNRTIVVDLPPSIYTYTDVNRTLDNGTFDWVAGQYYITQELLPFETFSSCIYWNNGFFHELHEIDEDADAYFNDAVSNMSEYIEEYDPLNVTLLNASEHLHHHYEEKVEEISNVHDAIEAGNVTPDAFARYAPIAEDSHYKILELFNKISNIYYGLRGEAINTWNYENRSLTEFPFITDIDYELVSNYNWNNTNRSLTEFSFNQDINYTLIQNYVWNASTRTLTVADWTTIADLAGLATQNNITSLNTTVNGLPLQIWTYTNRNLTYIQGEDIGLYVWNTTNRNLTYYPSVTVNGTVNATIDPSIIWAFSTRTLTDYNQTGMFEQLDTIESLLDGIDSTLDNIAEDFDDLWTWLRQMLQGGEGKTKTCLFNWCV